jgi:DNA-binding transcriptional LysR family regulator
MNFRYLQILIAVVECRGVSAAAEHLHVSQPAVSAALRTLEENVSAKLFERFSGGRRTRPTPEGMKLYAQAKDILQRWDAARKSLHEDDGRPRKIRLGVLHTLASEDIARAQRALAKHVAGWRWHIREGSASAIAADLRQDRADLLWTAVDSGDPFARTLWHEPYVAIVSRSHPLARSERLTIQVDDLKNERIVLRGTCELPRNSLQDAGLSIRPAAKADRDELAMSLVAQDFGYAIAPRSLATADVVPLAVSDLGLTRLIGIRWKRLDMGAAVDALAAILTEISSS